MKSDNAIIIALIVCIIIVFGAFFIISGNGISFAPQEQTDDANTLNASNINNVASTDGSYSSGSQSNGPDNENSAPSPDSDSSSNSEGDSSQVSDDASQSTPSESAGQSDSAPQAGQAEGTYDPSDFD